MHGMQQQCAAWRGVACRLGVDNDNVGRFGAPQVWDAPGGAVLLGHHGAELCFAGWTSVAGYNHAGMRAAKGAKTE